MPGRPLPHRLRRLTWMACVPVAVAVILLTIDFVEDKQRATPAPFTRIRPQARTPVTVMAPTDNTLLRLVEQMYPDSPRANAPISNQESAPTIPPLRAFAISMWIHGDSGTTLTLRCKDPAHDIAYCIGTDNPDRDVKLVGVDVDDKLARFTVSRGDEQYTFEFDRSREFHSPVIRFSSPGTVLGAQGYHSQVAASAKHPDLKAVPYFDNRGKCIGMRVTGLRSDSSWANRGIERGDVLLAADDIAMHQPAVFRKRVKGGWAPKSLKIGKIEGGGLREVELGG